MFFGYFFPLHCTSRLSDYFTQYVKNLKRDNDILLLNKKCFFCIKCFGYAKLYQKLYLEIFYSNTFFSQCLANHVIDAMILVGGLIFDVCSGFQTDYFI